MISLRSGSKQWPLFPPPCFIHQYKNCTSLSIKGLEGGKDRIPKRMVHSEEDVSQSNIYVGGKTPTNIYVGGKTTTQVNQFFSIHKV